MNLKQLIEDHPILQNVECGVYIGEGWVPILLKFCTIVERHASMYKDAPEVIVGQVKEKFGTMRCYIDQGDDYVRGAAAMMEIATCSICEDCGEIGKIRSGGWIRTLCDVCEIRQKKLRNT